MDETVRSGDKLNVFISYSRDDLAFSDQLAAALGVTGFDTTLDRHGITGGEDWKSRLGNLIRAADSVVFVLSPSSAQSDICAWEIEEATRMGKRILPVLCRPLGDARVPPRLAELNYIFFYAELRSAGSGFGAGLAALATALNTDLTWLREHTRYLERASEWDDGGRPANRLLSGDDVALAKSWSTTRPKNAPAPTALHLDFILASESEQARQQSAEAQRLQQLSQAQTQREAAFAERTAAQESEAAARTREAQRARQVVQRTRIGLAVAVVLGVTSAWFGWTAVQQREQVQAALEQFQKEQERRTAQAFEIGWQALAGLNVRTENETYEFCGSVEGLKGLRQIYCEIANVLSLQSLATLAEQPVFTSGPHVRANDGGRSLQYNLRSHQIGRYNPEFVDWMARHAVPAVSDPAFRERTQGLFDTHVKGTALNHYRAYLALFDPANRTARLRLKARFESDLQGYTAEMEGLRRSGGEDWLQKWSTSPSYKLQAGLASTIRSSRQDERPGADYELPVAMSFWMRRSLDGTHRQFFDILVSALHAYNALPADGVPKNLDAD